MDDPRGKRVEEYAQRGNRMVNIAWERTMERLSAGRKKDGING